MRFSGSVAVAADFDRDGDLDLFVGGRSVPGSYPLTPRSALLRNDAGRFVDVTDEMAPGLSKAGLVTSAIWSDADGDAWSDLDTIAFVEDGAIYSRDTGWQVGLEQALGLTLWFAAFSETGRGDWEVEMVLEGGRKVDIVFSQIRALEGIRSSLSQMIAAAPYHSVFGSGLRVLLEKDPCGEPVEPGSSTQITVPPVPTQSLPDQAVFDNLIANCFLELFRAAKLCGRGELWRAARVINYELQEQLLVLLELHTRSKGSQTWPYGRFLEQWADPRALAVLPGAFAGYSTTGIRRASLAGLDLITWLSAETALRLGLRDPIPVFNPASAWLKIHWD